MARAAADVARRLEFQALMMREYGTETFEQVVAGEDWSELAAIDALFAE